MEVYFGRVDVKGSDGDIFDFEIELIVSRITFREKDDRKNNNTYAPKKKSQSTKELEFIVFS